MNAPLPRDALAAFRATIPPASDKPRAVFRVRQRSMLVFDVVRTLSGPGVTPLGAAPATFSPFQGEDAANAFAARAAVRFSQENPGFVVRTEPFPRLGRRPGQAYSAPLPPEPNDELSAIQVTQEKIGAKLCIALHGDLLATLAAWPKSHVAILTTAYGKPFTAKGLGNKMADAIDAAGLRMRA